MKYKLKRDLPWAKAGTIVERSAFRVLRQVRDKVWETIELA